MPAETLTGTDREILEQLNRDDISSVQSSDVRRFGEILADDFLCSNPDGSLLDRTSYTTADGRAALGRCTDVWARRGDRWLAVSAHVTRG